MTFGNFVLLLMLAWILYSQGLPAPLKQFFSAIQGAFSSLILHTLALIIKDCLSYANNLQSYGQSLCSSTPCPEWEPPQVRYAEQIAYHGAGLFRGIGNFLMAQGTRFMSYSIGGGDTIGTIAMWLAVIGA